MYSIEELVNGGYPGYAGWGVTEANADFNATGGSGKEGGGSSGESGGILGNNIYEMPWTAEQQKAAEDKALAELTPYYNKLLSMYGGDVALAKQRLDQDYERGLRVQTQNKDWAKESNDQTVAERQRKFGLALKDLDQQLNQRGVFNSGIRTSDIAKATADEQRQQDLLRRDNEALDIGLAQYKEEKDLGYRQEAEKMGYVKPIDTALNSQYAPNTTGQITPAGYNVSNYISEPSIDTWKAEQEKLAKVQDQAVNTRQQAYGQWAADAVRLAKA